MVVSAAINGAKWVPISSSPVHHKFTESMILDTIKTSEFIITKWDSDSSSLSLFHHPTEAQQFLKHVNDLSRLIHFLLSQNSSSVKLALAQNLIKIAITRLKKELLFLFSSPRQELDEEDEIMNPTNGSISDLKSIADCMFTAGYCNEFINTYKLVRKLIVRKTIYLLGIETLRSSQILKLNLEVLQNMINNWKNAIKIAVRKVFSGEKSLCDRVFSSCQAIRESCFFEIVEESAMNLFRFPQIVAKTKKSPEKVVPLMELYKTLFNLRPEIEVIFSSESTSSIQLQVISSLDRLSKSVQALLSDFESTIQKDSSKTPVPGGGIHPLTRTVTNYLSLLAEYSPVLSESVPDSPLANSNEKDSAVSSYLAWLILVLLCKLDQKAKGYKDVALSYLFLANNLQFIVQKVRETRLESILGEEWIYEHSRKVKKYSAGYELMAWNRVLSSLPDKNSGAEVSDEAAKECFERFNVAFEEAYKKQATWIVEDVILRNEIKVSIERKVVGVYRDFYNWYWRRVSGEKNSEMVVRFGPDDLENYLSDLFHGPKISDDISSSESASSVRGYCILGPR